MNLRLQRLLQLHRLMDEANDGSGQGGGTGGGGVDDGTKKPGEGQGEGGEGDGGSGAKPKPTDAEARLLKDVMKHKAAAQASEAKLAELAAELKKFEGIDPVKVRELLDKQAEEERKALENRGEYDRLVKQMGERHTADLAAANAKGAEALAQVSALNARIADLTVGAAFSTSTFREKETVLPVSKARALYGSHFEFKDGVVVGYDKPAGASERTLLVDAAGTPLSFDAALEAIVDADPDRDYVRRSKMKPGAGSGTSGREKPNAQETKELTPVQKIAAGLKALHKKS